VHTYVHVRFLFSFFLYTGEIFSRKQILPLVDSSSTMVRCSRVFIFMRRTPINEGKLKRKKEEKRREENVRY